MPANVRRIPAAGNYLMPGLGEMHGHNPPPGSTREYIESVYFLFIANGVTTVRSMLGWPGQLELREQVQRGEIEGPTLYLAGPAFNGRSVRSAAEAAERVRQQKGEGWDLLKVLTNLKRDHYDAMARTAREVGISFAGHVPEEVGLAHAIASGQETIDHLDGYMEYMEALTEPVDDAKLADAVKLTVRSGVRVVPTMALWETAIGAADLARMLEYPELDYMPRAEVDRWREIFQRRINRPEFNRAQAEQLAANRKVLLKALHDGGAKILFGTDAPQQFSVPAFSVHRELRSMTEAGMTPFEVLSTATRNIGDYLKKEDAFGTVAVGQRADLLLLTANPLEDVGNVAKRSGVMVRGRWLPEAEIQTRLAKIAAAVKNESTER